MSATNDTLKNGNRKNPEENVGGVDQGEVTFLCSDYNTTTISKGATVGKLVDCFLAKYLNCLSTKKDKKDAETWLKDMWSRQRFYVILNCKSYNLGNKPERPLKEVRANEKPNNLLLDDLEGQGSGVSPILFGVSQPTRPITVTRNINVVDQNGKSHTYTVSKVGTQTIGTTDQPSMCLSDCITNILKDGVFKPETQYLCVNEEEIGVDQYNGCKLNESDKVTIHQKEVRIEPADSSVPQYQFQCRCTQFALKPFDVFVTDLNGARQALLNQGRLYGRETDTNAQVRNSPNVPGAAHIKQFLDFMKNEEVQERQPIVMVPIYASNANPWSPTYMLLYKNKNGLLDAGHQ